MAWKIRIEHFSECRSRSPFPDGVVGGSKDMGYEAVWSRHSLSAATLVEAKPRAGFTTATEWMKML